MSGLLPIGPQSFQIAIEPGRIVHLQLSKDEVLRDPFTSDDRQTPAGEEARVDCFVDEVPTPREGQRLLDFRDALSDDVKGR